MYKKGHFACPLLWCSSYTPVLFSGAAAGVTAGCRGKALQWEWMLIFKKSVLWKIPLERKFCLWLKIPCTQTSHLSRQNVPWNRNNGIVTGPSSSRQDWCCQSGGLFPAAWEHGPSHGKLQTCNPDVRVPSLVKGLWWADTAPQLLSWLLPFRTSLFIFILRYMFGLGGRTWAYLYNCFFLFSNQ